MLFRSVYGNVAAEQVAGILQAAREGRELTEGALFKLTRDRGHTLILVTHNTDVAARCNRTLHLRDGKLS